MSRARSVDARGLATLRARADRPVLVDLWASWCPPCRALAPVIDALAERLVGRVDVVKLDVDAEPELAESLGVTSIPTIVVFLGEDEVARRGGTATLDELIELVEASTGE